MSLQRRFFPPDASFLRSAAEATLSFVGGLATPVSLAQCRVIVPNLKLAAPLAEALGNAAGGEILLPRIETLSGTVEPWVREVEYMPDVRRQLVLHALLRGKAWFDEAVLWDVVGELTALFDTLTDYAVALPDSEAQLLQRLETAFGLRDAEPLAFEARLVHTLWLAEAHGVPSLRAARLLALRRWVEHVNEPVIVLAEDERDPVLLNLIDVVATKVPLLKIAPDRNSSDEVIAEALKAAWPLCDDGMAVPLIDRAHAISGDVARTFTDVVTLCEAASLEDLAEYVREQVLSWLKQGRERIALIAADRLVARRARALLERDGVLVDDETGWMLSTTRAAATVDAWLEVLVSDGYHRALIDLLRSPFVFGDIRPEIRAQYVSEIERIVRKTGMTSGLQRIHEAVLSERPEAAVLLTRMMEMRRLMAMHQRVSICAWLRRLNQALEGLAVLEGMAEDAAGHAWLDWLHQRQEELAEDGEVFGFSHWRNWLHREMDASMFRDVSIESPVIMTHLAATRLRAFDAAIVIGADGEHLAPPKSPAWLTHAGVRRELGLPGLDLDRWRIREDLAGLILATGKTVICWQGNRRDEIVLPSPDIDVLVRMLDVACNKHVVTHAKLVLAFETLDVQALGRSCPPVPAPRIPTRISASGLQTLFDCPYRYFARYVLGLQENIELVEGLEKRDFGTCLHGILQKFHTEWPTLACHETETLVSALARLSEEAFAPWIKRNFLDQAWRIRWMGRLEQYIDWQRQREGAGWRVEGHELELSRALDLRAGRSLELKGRIDRRDTRDQERSVLDYKSRGLTALRKQVKDEDDVQLAFYALLSEQLPSEAAYVALDDDKIGAIAVEDVENTAENVKTRLLAAFSSIEDGVGMPAHGVESACNYCEMKGLCREEWLR